MRFVLSLLVLSVIVHYVFGRYLFTSFPKLRIKPWRKRVQGALFFFAALPFALRVLTRFSWNPVVTDLLAFSLIELMTLGIALAPMLVFYTGRRVLFGKPKKQGDSKTVVKATEEETEEQEDAHEQEKGEEEEDGDAVAAKVPSATPIPLLLPLTRREAVERIVGVAAYGSVGAMLGWGMVRGRHAFELEEVVVKIKNLPKALDGYVIAQVSDIHAGAFVRERELDEGFELVRKIKPDLLVVTGDIVDFEAGWTNLFARRFSDLPARDGRIAILGNHDYYADTSIVKRSLKESKIDLLMNEGRVIRPGDGGGFALLGVDDLWAPRVGGVGPDLSRAIAMVPPDLPRILLAHQPKYFDQAFDRVALQLSGHTHGGQINPGFRPAALIMEYVSGRYTRGDSTLWVNRGFGVAGPPSRVASPPEVTKVVLVAA